MKLETTSYEVNDRVALVTLNRPDHMNSFTTKMMEELVEIFGEASRDDAVRAVVVTGAGKAFCAGADLSRGESTFDHSAGGKNVGVSPRRDGGGRDGGGRGPEVVARAVHGCAAVGRVCR